MIDEELREELASIRNLLNEVLVNQDILAKRINADTAMKATQAERAVEIARLQKTALKAIRKTATVDWGRVFQLIDRVDALGEAAGTALPHWTVYMGNQSLVFVMAEGSASSLSKASPPQHGVESWQAHQPFRLTSSEPNLRANQESSHIIQRPGIASFGGAFVFSLSIEDMRTLEDFREETRRKEAYFWGLVRQSERREPTFCQLYECSRCGKLSHQKHQQNCFDLKPLDISKEEKIQRMDDPHHEQTWSEIWPLRSASIVAWSFWPKARKELADRFVLTNRKPSTPSLSVWFVARNLIASLAATRPVLKNAVTSCS